MACRPNLAVHTDKYADGGRVAAEVGPFPPVMVDAGLLDGRGGWSLGSGCRAAGMPWRPTTADACRSRRRGVYPVRGGTFKGRKVQIDATGVPRPTWNSSLPCPAHRSAELHPDERREMDCVGCGAALVERYSVVASDSVAMKL